MKVPFLSPVFSRTLDFLLLYLSSIITLLSCSRTKLYILAGLCVLYNMKHNLISSNDYQRNHRLWCLSQ